jgi:hypothetical protein
MNYYQVEFLTAQPVPRPAKRFLTEEMAKKHARRVLGLADDSTFISRVTIVAVSRDGTPGLSQRSLSWNGSYGHCRARKLSDFEVPHLQQRNLTKMAGRQFQRHPPHWAVAMGLQCMWRNIHTGRVASPSQNCTEARLAL